ncbi:MAG TPA: TlpA disulfide reductase family protein [Blastocatellia bacterium]|nr:TlpA disulfide reductase family protein [Blastocatellia bacterium]
MSVDNAAKADDLKSGDKLWTPGRIIATVVMGVLIATVGVMIFSGGSGPNPRLNVALPGTPVSNSGEIRIPEDFSLPALDGGSFRLSDYRGKVLVVDFWATWCPPCREEVPQLARIASENRSRGVEVIGLHIDDNGRSTPADIRKFIGQYGINYTVGMAGNDVFTSYLGHEDDRIPQTLVFDRDGHLILHLSGYTPADARLLDEAVNRALAAS